MEDRTDGDDLRCSMVVAPGTPRRVARAVTRYRLTSFASYGPLLVLLGIVLLVGRGGAVTLAAVLAVVLGLLVVAPLVQLGRLARVLAARGFAPGTTMTVDWQADAFTVTSADGHARHAYADVRAVRRLGDVVGVRLAAARLLLALPEELVPPDAVQRLTAAALRNRVRR